MAPIDKVIGGLLLLLPFPIDFSDLLKGTGFYGVLVLESCQKKKKKAKRRRRKRRKRVASKLIWWLESCQVGETTTTYQFRFRNKGEESTLMFHASYFPHAQDNMYLTRKVSKSELLLVQKNVNWSPTHESERFKSIFSSRPSKLILTAPLTSIFP